MTVFENLVDTTEPAFACNCNGRIVDWNQGAERLLGHASSDVVGRHCFQVLDGKDVFGNRFCHERCAIRSMILRREPVNPWQLNYQTASRERIDVVVAPFVLSGNSTSDFIVVHVLRPVDNTAEATGAGVAGQQGHAVTRAEPETEDSCAEELTARETEILRLLAAGTTTRDIVSRLSISEDTVRTHIRNILNKLDVHSRLQAVCLAVDRRLI